MQSGKGNSTNSLFNIPEKEVAASMDIKMEAESNDESASAAALSGSRRELHEYCSERRVLPRYTIKDGPAAFPNDCSVYIAICKVGEYEATGTGKNKLLAKSAAAASMLAELKKKNLPTPPPATTPKFIKKKNNRPERPKMEDVDKLYKLEELGPYMRALQEKCLAKGASAQVSFFNGQHVKCVAEIDTLGTIVGEGDSPRAAKQQVGEKAYAMIKQRIAAGTITINGNFGKKTAPTTLDDVKPPTA